jgi:predicted nucleotidyltransferase
MISAQCDRLRELAIRANELYEYEMERELDQAADTIWQLRDDLQQANDENSKLIVKLNAEHIVRQNVEIENVKLKAQECTLESMHGYCDPYVRTAYVVELSCHTLDAWDDPVPPSYCPYCGKRVVKEDA